MDIRFRTVEQATVVEIVGEIDGKTAPEAQRTILSLIEPGGKILLDMTQVTFMSSAGLRVLLATYRQVTSSKGQVVLVALSAEIEDTMSLTGFMRFFSVYDDVDSALAALS